MQLTTLNNATLICESSKGTILTLDPWIIGSLYFNTWIPSTKASNAHLEKLCLSNYVYISHLHSDHWDPETIKLFKSDTKFILPELPFIKKVIGEKLNNYGFYNIYYIKPLSTLKIENDFSITFIPTLNYYGAEIEIYETSSDDFEKAIDTGLIINDLSSKTSHIALCDNTPYLPESGKLIKELVPIGFNIGSIWYPFNGAAQDFPLCYDNLDFNEKKKLVNERNNKRNKCILNLKNFLDSEVLIPYSSDFLLVGKRSDEFLAIHSESLKREWSAKELNLLSKDNKFKCLNPGDSIKFKNKSNSFEIIRDALKKECQVSKSNKRNSFFINKYNLDELNQLLEISLKALFNRMKKHKLKDIKLPFIIHLYDLNLDVIINFYSKKFVFNFSKRCLGINNINNLYDEFVYLATESFVFGDWLSGKAHFDNLAISCLLNWYRKTINNRYPRELYDALNFFHV